MQTSPSLKSSKITPTARASLCLLGFGLALLTFLIAIDRPQWFVLRPASGTAAALAKASVNPVDTHETARVGAAASDAMP
ncbi:hypothetical protein [Sphingomonas sp. PAMC 26605]|uniref:hypothetical protein n=1 Tax=Sphingomonas sp. PAMC 26605 TaxID=1112214 RepID=UPI00026CD72B|nr:hypothetical protein [Sphingomonas sp. PAMC 26605]